MAKISGKKAVKIGYGIGKQVKNIKLQQEYNALRKKYYQKRKQAKALGINIGNTTKIPKRVTEASVSRLKNSIASLDIKIEKQKGKRAASRKSKTAAYLESKERKRQKEHLKFRYEQERANLERSIKDVANSSLKIPKAVLTYLHKEPPKKITQKSIDYVKKLNVDVIYHSKTFVDDKKIQRDIRNYKYEKARDRLLGNIDRLSREGYEMPTYINRWLENLYKRENNPKKRLPTEKNISTIEDYNAKLLKEAVKYYKNGVKTRKQIQAIERRKRSSEKALQQGKILSDKKRKELLKERLNNAYTGEPLALKDIRVIKYIDRVEETFFRLEHTLNRKGEVNRSLIEWITDWRSLFHDWVNSHNDAERMSAFEQVDWSKFMVKYYSSDGVGLYDFLVDFEHEMLLLTGMQPKVNISDVDLTDYEQFIAQDLGV